jgi:hypothetical protein
MGRRLVAVGAALASAGVALAWAPGASAVTFAETCAADPGAIAPSITNDAAIEVHALRRELAQDCVGLLERADGLADRVELAWVGVWFLGGVTVVSLFAPAFFRAWRFWSE